jgi:hypothetical protein
MLCQAEPPYEKTEELEFGLPRRQKSLMEAKDNNIK